MTAFNSLDYRRFDHLASDSESDEEPQDQPSLPDLVRRCQQDYSASNPANEMSQAQQTGSFRFHPVGGIKVHPADDTAPAWVYTDPETWEAPRDPSKKHRLLHADSVSLF